MTRRSCCTSFIVGTLLIGCALLLLDAYGERGVAVFALGQEAREGQAPQLPNKVAIPHDAQYSINAEGQLMRTHDGGSDFETMEGLPGRAVTLHEAEDVLYVGTESAGLLRSTDGGVTWQIMSTDLGPMPNLAVTAIATSPRDPRQVVIATGYWLGTSDAHFAPFGVFRSGDGGESWRLISSIATEATVESLVIDSRIPDIVRARLSDGTVLVLNA